MASEEEAFTLVMHISDAAVQSAREIALALLRMIAGSGGALLPKLASSASRGAHAVIGAGADRIDGHGSIGRVSMRTIGPESRTILLPHGAMDRDDMRALSREMRKAGIPFAASIDANGDTYLFFRVEHEEAFTAVLAKVAADLGASKGEIECEPIRRLPQVASVRDGSEAEYPDKFEACGLAFERDEDDGRWHAKDPADERVQISIWRGGDELDAGCFEISRNGRTIDSGSGITLLEGQPIEDAALAAKSSLDRHHRPEERERERKRAIDAGKAHGRSGSAGSDRRKPSPSEVHGKARTAAARASGGQALPPAAAEKEGRGR